ncbi:MAG TPA: hypothetical protein PKA31_00975 [Candidatus Moranbacteria bacterium]|nr:hypothetical protein [Candidatus Moranbacteria bacterium]
MDERSYQLHIIDQLEKNETALAKLYGAYARLFPSNKVFWEGLVLDETSHARWISTLRRKVEEGEISFGSNRFNIDVINDFAKAVALNFKEAENPLPLVSALERAVRLEETMVEKEYFAPFAEDSLDMEIVLSALRYSSINHLESVRKALMQEKEMIAKGAATS